ncbi:MAG: 50S ribosomal protein L32 [Patescibacteria group bacterium]
MSSRMRETKGHTGNRRSHHKITAPRLSVCSNCKEYHKRHSACAHCGHYRGKALGVMKTSTTASVSKEESGAK